VQAGQADRMEEEVQIVPQQLVHALVPGMPSWAVVATVVAICAKSCSQAGHQGIPQQRIASAEALLDEVLAWFGVHYIGTGRIWSYVDLLPINQPMS